MFSSVATTADRASATCRCVSAEGSVGWRGANGGGGAGAGAWASAGVVDGDAMDGGGEVGWRGEREREADDEDEAAAAVDMIAVVAFFYFSRCVTFCEMRSFR